MTLAIQDGAQRALNDLARHQMKSKLLADINVDMLVCQIEGWDAMEYLDDIREELDKLPRRIHVMHEPKGTEIPLYELLCSECSERVSRFRIECPHCGAKWSGTEWKGVVE